MSKGVKVLLIGCLSVIVISAIVLGVGTYFATSWFKKKTETLGNLVGTENSEYGKKLSELKKDYPFTPPSDNVITDDELTRYLSVRKSVFDVYKKHKEEIDKLSKQSNPDWSGAMNSLGILNDVHMAKVDSLQENHLGPDEYEYLTKMIYSTWAAATTKDALKDKSLKQLGSDTLKSQIEGLDKQINDPKANPEVKKQLQAVRDQLQKQLDELQTNPEYSKPDEALNSIPQQNIDLFKKHEEEIKKYSLAGLEMLGF